MRTAPVRTIALLAVFLYCTSPAWAVEVPELRRYVTDMAGVLSAGEQDRIEAMLSQYDQERKQQFVVLIIPSLEGESLEDYSMRVAEKNRIGHEGVDNGLLFLVSVNDRKMRFEVGYGLEGELTDAVTSLIISDVVAPAFRSGNFAEGISAGMETAIKISTGEFTVSQSSPRREKKKGGNMMGLIIFLVIMYIIIKGNRGGRGGGIWFIGGPFGGGGGGGFGGGGFGGGGFGGFSGGGGGFGGGGSSGSW
jgi:uncharacterized protein